MQARNILIVSVALLAGYLCGALFHPSPDTAEWLVKYNAAKKKNEPPA